MKLEKVRQALEELGVKPQEPKVRPMSPSRRRALGLGAQAQLDRLRTVSARLKPVQLFQRQHVLLQRRPVRQILESARDVARIREPRTLAV